MSMETFEQWLGRQESGIDPLVLAEMAWNSSKAQSRNYVADDAEMPEKITFANGRVVYIADNKSPGVQHGVYLEVAQRPD